MSEWNRRRFSLETKQTFAHRNYVFVSPAGSPFKNFESSCRDCQDDVVEGTSFHVGRTASCAKPAIFAYFSQMRFSSSRLITSSIVLNGKPPVNSSTLILM